MNKAKSIFCVMVAVLCGYVMKAQSVTFSSLNAQGWSLNYVVTDSIGHAVAVSGDRTVEYAGEFVIPDTVGYNGVLCTVTSIASNGFSQYHNVTSFRLPSTIDSIGELAFFWCLGLSELTIPTQTSSIGYAAFYPIPNVIYDGTADIAYGKPLSINAYEEDSLFFKDETKTYLAGVRKEIATANLPSSIDTIGAFAFCGCNNLASIDIPTGVLSINRQAFRTCLSLRHVSIPSTVTTIEEQAFMFCGNDECSITIADAATSIGAHAFEYCYAVAIDLGMRTYSIGNNAFAYCQNLQSISLPPSVQEVGDSCFMASGIQSASIMASITALPHAAFLFCQDLASVWLPTSLEQIADQAFLYCGMLWELDIPEGVVQIGDQALGYCSGLQHIVCRNVTPPSTTGSSFSGCNSNAAVTVPCHSGNAYSSDLYWSHFTHIEEDCAAIDDAFEEEPSVEIQQGAIVVEGMASQRLYIFDTHGHSVYSGKNGHAYLPSTGVYLIKIGDGAAVKKVITAGLYEIRAN